MDASGPLPFRPIPFQAAQAYGVRTAGGRDSSATEQRAGRTPAQTVAAGARITPPFADSAERVDHLSTTLSALVSGTVQSAVSRGAGFDPAPSTVRSVPTPVTPVAAAAPGSFALYNRAADRIEVATAVSVGRQLDTRG